MKTAGCHVNGEGTTLLHEGAVPYITFPLLTQTGAVRHGFSTRQGGVSSGIYASMNLDFRCREPQENVRENYRRITAALDLNPDDLVLSAQTHTTNIRRMTSADRGKGFARERDYTDVDGMITDDPDVVLVGLFADCVPVLFTDPVRHAIALSHAGWRGTAGRIAEKTVWAMTEAFGTCPTDLYCAIGPSICRNCYEVGSDVADALRAAFPARGRAAAGTDISFSGRTAADIITSKGGGKYLADLHLANALALRAAGVPETQIAVTDLCTACRSDLLWSHRATHGQRGEMAAFLQLR